MSRGIRAWFWLGFACVALAPGPEGSSMRLSAAADVMQGDASSTTPVSARPADSAPQVWAVVVGVDRYADVKIPSCRGAVKDARAVREWLTETAGWDTDHVLLLTDGGQDSPPEGGDGALHLKPSRANLEWAIHRWLEPRVRPGDVALIYFAGHSVALSPEAKVAGSSREFLLPIDCQSDFLERSGWSFGDAIDRLAASGRGPVACLLDTSPRGRGRPLPFAKEAADSTRGARMLRNIARWPGVTVWMGAVDQVAAEADVGGAGRFTSALLAALGSPRRPHSLLACLDTLYRDRGLAAQGFRMLGGIGPGVSLWPRAALPSRPIDPDVVLQRGHADKVVALEFTADGALMATAGDDSTVRLWRMRDQVLLRVLSYHAVGVTQLAISGEGRWLASGDGRGGLRVWDLLEDSAKVLPPTSPHQVDIVTLEFLPDGLLLSADSSGQWSLWDCAGPTIRHVPPPGKLAVGARMFTCARFAGPVAAAMVLTGARGDDRVGLYGGDDAEPARIVPGPGGAIVHLALSDDGRRLVLATDGGRIELRDTETNKVVWQTDLEAPIRGLRLSAGRIVVESASALHIIDMDKPENPQELAEGERFEQVAFSPNGRHLAGTTKRGAVRVWRLDPQGGAPLAVPLAPGDIGGALAIAFTADGATLVVGQADGGLHAWDLDSERRAAAILPHRGQVVHVAAAADGVHMLQVTRDGVATLWNLQEGRGPVLLDGRFAAGGVFLPGTDGMILADDRGDLVRFSLDGRRDATARYERPALDGLDQPVQWGFKFLSVSARGEYVAAGSPDGPLACVWDITGGPPLRLIGEPHEDPLVAVQFSSDGKMLLTASEDGVAAVWDLGSPGRAPAKSIRCTASAPLTAAAMAPRNGGGIALAVDERGLSRVELWGDRDQPRVLGPVRGRIAALAFTDGGDFLAAATWDKLLSVWTLRRAFAPVELLPRPQHEERINTVAAWPGKAMYISGSDDTTVRFWRLDPSTGKGSLLGSLAASQSPSDWVAFAPGGAFDGSPSGVETATRRIRSEDPARLDQWYGVGHVFGLTDYLRKGEVAPPAPNASMNPPPRLALEPASEVEGRQAELSLRIGEGGLQDLRLYHNGCVIRSELERELGAGENSLAIKVNLLGGKNEFYAMAGKPGALDGRSNVVELEYAGPTEPGRVHVVAIGVGKYQRQSLQFATVDAKAIAEFLKKNGLKGEARENVSHVLLDEHVTRGKLDEAFARVRTDVSGRPQDTVVVFLAGHTDVRNDRFCLLLPSAQLPEGPLVVAARAGGAAREPAKARGRAGLDDPTVLPYALVQRNLSYLDALQRLVIVDACQAEAILGDETVRRAREIAERESRLSRTSYLLAARRGEMANEVDQLRHGLFTYVLLRGMGDTELEDVPGIDIFEQQRNADFDRNQEIDTAELRRFVDLTLPPLAAHFPQLVRRGPGGDAAPRQGAGDARVGEPAQHLTTLDSQDEPFPLVGLSRK